MRKLESFVADKDGFDLMDCQGDSLLLVSRQGGLVTYLAGPVAGCFTPDSVIGFLIKDDAYGKLSLFMKIRMTNGIAQDWPCGELINAEEATRWVDILNRFYENLHLGSPKP